MGWIKKYDFSFFQMLSGLFALAVIACACTPDKPDGTDVARLNAGTVQETAADQTGEAAQSGTVNRAALLFSLENIIEQERSGAFTQGMGIRESIIRENLDDPAGAVMAAYKELAWAYGMGIIDMDARVQGMQNALNLHEVPALAAQACLAFIQEQWAESEAILQMLDTGEEIDSIVQWMILCCVLEQNRDNLPASDSYRAIRARYAKFPEYWYRGARVFSGAVSAEYAEYCLALAPAGPYAAECRLILALSEGLNPQDSPFLLSRPEIEKLISRSINEGEPRLLEQLMPLISLPDNSHTVYAVGLLRSLSSVPMFRAYFMDTSVRTSGRLAERLAYICRTGS